MPSIDQKSAELSRLKSRLAELDNLLKEQKKIGARMEDQRNKKQKQIDQVDDTILNSLESFRWKRSDLLSTMEAREKDAAAEIESLQKIQHNLLLELTDYDTLEYFNGVLQGKLREMAQVQQSTAAKYLEEAELIRQKNFDRRISMEEIVRKTIRKLDKKYAKSSVQTMLHDAAEAAKENELIRQRSDITEKETVVLIRQQQKSYERLMKLKMECDVMKMSADIQAVSLAKLSESNLVYQRELLSLAESVEVLNDEVHALELSVTNQSRLNSECKRLRDVISTAKKCRKSASKGVIEVCSDLLQVTQAIAAKQAERQKQQLSASLGRLQLSPTPTIDYDTPLGMTLEVGLTGDNYGEDESLSVIEDDMSTILFACLENEVSNPPPLDTDAFWRSKVAPISSRFPRHSNSAPSAVNSGSFSMMF